MWCDRTSVASRAGYTLVEVLVSVAISALIMVAALVLISTSAQVNQQIEAQTDTTVMANEALSDLRWRLTSSRKLLDRSAQGDEYMKMLDLDGAPPRYAATRLPRVEVSAVLSPRAKEFEQDSVGNALLFAEVLEPFTDEASGRRVDVYRFVYYYLSPRSGESLGGVKEVLDLIRFESVRYADFTQLDSLEGETASQVAGALLKEGIRYAWDVDAPTKGAFSQIGYSGLVRPPIARHVIERGNTEPAVLGVGVGQASSGLRALTVARNQSPDFPIAADVPRFAEAGEDGFPAGFEVLVGGPTRGRKVLLRLVLASWSGGRFASGQGQLLVAVGD